MPIKKRLMIKIRNNADKLVPRRLIEIPMPSGVKYFVEIDGKTCEVDIEGAPVEGTEYKLKE